MEAPNGGACHRLVAFGTRMTYNFHARERVARSGLVQRGLCGGSAPHESSYNAKHRFQGGGEAGMNPAALIAQLRSVPTTLGQPESGPYRVARPRMTRDDRRLPRNAARHLQRDAYPEDEPMTPLTNRPPYQLFVGIDIAATTFTAVWTTDGPPRERARPFAQTPAGFAALQDQLRATGVAPAHILIVVEATGSYWVALAVCLHQAGYVVSVVNPAQAHNYAKSLPRRAKTDVLDAPVLAQFAAERKPAPWTPHPAVYHELRQRLVARDAL